MADYITKIRVKENGTIVKKQIDYNALANLPTITQTTGDSETAIMSQKAVTDALANAGGSQLYLHQCELRYQPGPYPTRIVQFQLYTTRETTFSLAELQNWAREKENAIQGEFAVPAYGAYIQDSTAIEIRRFVPSYLKAQSSYYLGSSAGMQGVNRTEYIFEETDTFTDKVVPIFS